MVKRERSQGHYRRNIKHAIGHVGKVLSDLSPGTWGQMMQKPQAAESLTLRSPELHLDESQKMSEDRLLVCISHGSLVSAGCHRPALWLNWSARNYRGAMALRPDGLPETSLWQAGCFTLQVPAPASPPWKAFLTPSLIHFCFIDFTATVISPCFLAYSFTCLSSGSPIWAGPCLYTADPGAWLMQGIL